MRLQDALVLIAGVSLRERRVVESILKRTGVTTVIVDDADDAQSALGASALPSVLVIDSGQLEAPHDPQWRELRRCHPDLGAAVRCLISPLLGPQQRDARTFLVHPDDARGLFEVVLRLVHAARGRSSCAAPVERIEPVALPRSVGVRGS